MTGARGGLSGFLIAGLLLNETKRHKSVDVRRFLVRRGWKIYPLYFMFVGYIILSPVARAVVNGGSPTEVFSDQLSLHWPNLVFLQNYVGSGSIGHLWSIAVEEHFYLLLPLVVGLLGYRHSRKLIWIGFAGVGFFLALLAIPPFRITGMVHVPIGSRPVDGLLMSHDRFLTMTEVTIASPDLPKSVLSSRAASWPTCFCMTPSSAASAART